MKPKVIIYRWTAGGESSGSRSKSASVVLVGPYSDMGNIEPSGHPSEGNLRKSQIVCGYPACNVFGFKSAHFHRRNLSGFGSRTGGGLRR